MHWKLKAAIQNTVSILPSSTSYTMYYMVQRHFGGLRRINPVKSLTAGIETWKRIKEAGYDPSQKVFFEVGTGRMPIGPLSFWLMGAKSTVTIDVNPYIKEELIKEAIGYISENNEEIQLLFGSLLDNSRLEAVCSLCKSPAFSEHSFLKLCQIEYIAPGDAAKTLLEDKSIDIYTSYNVLEHIPRQILSGIIQEGNRIINVNGLFVHRIDYSDHFSHSDKSISAINFLQYSDSEWDRYAGNRYMYMNRLRHDDFLELFESAGHRILTNEASKDNHSLELLSQGTLPLNERFKNKSEEILSITDSWLVTQKVG